jgi:hypothetical protein
MSKNTTSTMRAIKEGDKIFCEVAKSFSWTETQSLEQAAQFLEKLKVETDGLVIIDFLDAGNWDCFEGIEIDDATGFLKIHWHDYRNVRETALDKEMRMLAFPASLYSLLLKFKELRIVNTKNYPVFTLRGYALKDKEIKTYLGKDSDEFKIFDNKDNFSKLAIRKVNSQFESYTCLNTPIFSMIIIPKNSGASAFSSKKALFSYNLSDSIVRLNKVKDELEKEDLVDEDVICEKANSIRRIFEYVLKVELCYRYRQLSVKKDYSDLMLGDLMSLVKPYRDEAINDFLRQITVWSNELSHESGKPIKRETALALSLMTILYTNLLKSEMSLNPHPSHED